MSCKSTLAKWVFVSTLLFSGLFLSAQSSEILISNNDAFDIADSYIHAKSDIENTISIENSNAILLNHDKNPVAYLFNLKPKGFIIISLRNFSNPIIGYSFQNNFDIENFYSDNIVSAVITGIAKNEKINTELEKKLFDKGVNTIFQIGPFVESIYGQVNCYDINITPIYPTNYYTPNHYAPGCVAISFITMMQYYEWPHKGLGIHQDIDSYGNSTGIYVANFDEAVYNWTEILPVYKYVASTDAEQEEIGKLSYHAAISLDMNFENTGSSSNVNRIPAAGKDYFSYISIYKGYNPTNFWTSLDTNMFHSMPVTLAVEASNGAGHSCVVDGMKMEDDSSLFYHLNMGWWGASNGWYKIRSNFSAGGYNSITGGVFDFMPKPYMETPKKLPEGNLYKLEWDISDNIEVEEYELRRKINTGLWHTLETNGLDDTLIVEVGAYDDYFFEVRAKIDGHWYNNGWSNRVKAEEDDTGIQDIDGNVFSVFPNPCKDILEIDIPENIISGKKTIEVYNINGVKIQTDRIPAGKSSHEIRMKDLTNGIYFVNIISKNDNTFLKIIKY